MFAFKLNWQFFPSADNNGTFLSWDIFVTIIRLRCKLRHSFKFGCNRSHTLCFCKFPFILGMLGINFPPRFISSSRYTLGCVVNIEFKDMPAAMTITLAKSRSTNLIRLNADQWLAGAPTTHTSACGILPLLVALSARP